MPILKREVSLFPEQLFSEQFRHGEESDGRSWWAVYTISRREKDLMRRLKPMQIPFYCPLVSKSQRSPGGRVRTSYIPLFSNYVFMFATEVERIKAFESNCISRCLPVTDEEQLIKDLGQVEQLLQADVSIVVETQLQPGTLVRIKSGPFTDYEGVVFKRKNQSHFMVTVNYLQQGVSMVLNEWDLEKIY